MTPNDLLRTAEKVVAYAVRHGADAAEAFVERSETGGVHVEKNLVRGVEAESTQGIGLRIVRGGRVGFAHFARPAEVAEALRDAEGTARLGKRLPRFSFPPPRPVPRVSGVFDARIAQLEAAGLLSHARDLVRGAREARRDVDVTEAGASFGHLQMAIANSEGLRRAGEETSVSASCFVVQSKEGVSTGFATQESTRLDLDPLALGEEAGRLALAARNPAKVEAGGRRTLILRPDPAADLLSTVTLEALVGRSARRGESYYSGKIGRRVAHPKVSVVDDPTLARGLGSSPFDDEGVPSHRYAPISRGVLKGYFFDRAAAAEFRSRETGSALRVHPFDGRSYKSPPGAGARNVRLEAPGTRTEKLVAGVDDGLLVHDMMGVHTANLASGDFSVTSTVLFRIRKGAVEGPVAPVAVAGNVHQALRDGLLLGDDWKKTSAEGAVEIPSVRFDSFTVTP